MENHVKHAAAELASLVNINDNQQKAQLEKIQRKVIESSTTLENLVIKKSQIEESAQNLDKEVDKLKDLFARIDRLYEATQSISQSVNAVAAAVTRAENHFGQLLKGDGQDIVAMDFDRPVVFSASTLIIPTLSFHESPETEK